MTAVRPEPVRVLIEPVAGGGAVHRRLAAGDPVPSPGTDPRARRIQAEKVDVDVDVDGAVWELNGERRGGGSRRGGAPARPGRGRAEREGKGARPYQGRGAHLMELRGSSELRNRRGRWSAKAGTGTGWTGRSR